MLNFAPKPSSGLSQASIFGASLGGLLLNSRNKHPNETIRDDSDVDDDGRIIVPEGLSKAEKQQAKDDYLAKGGHHVFYTRPLIDYDMALFLAPMEMAGAVLGVLVQKILPNWLYLTIAAVVLSFTSYKTYRKYFATRKAEKTLRDEEAKAEEAYNTANANNGASSALTMSVLVQNNLQGDTDGYTPAEEAIKEEVVAVEDNQGEEVGLGGIEKNDTAAPETALDDESPEAPADNDDDDNNDNEAMDPDEALALRREFLEQDSRQYPKDKLLGLLVLWIGLVLLTFFKGGKGVESIIGITCNSPWYAVLICIQFAWTLGFALVFGLKLVKRQAAKKAVQYPFLPNDVLWDNKKLRFYAFFTFIAGVVAGLIGIGGGMVLGPLMLVMGIHPRVSSATTATMIVLTSSSVAILFVTAGLVPWEYAVFFFFVCLSGAFVGKKYIDGYVKRTGKASLLIFILATIIALATIGCIVIVILRLSKAGWCFAGFNEFCNVKEGDEEDACAAVRMLHGAAELLSLFP